METNKGFVVTIIKKLVRRLTSSNNVDCSKVRLKSCSHSSTDNHKDKTSEIIARGKIGLKTGLDYLAQK